MPWEALCRHWRYGPVTTEPFGVRLQLLSHRRLTVCGWQIYSSGDPRALCDKLMSLRTYLGMSMVKDAFYGLDLAPAIDPSWLGSETESVGQSEQRPFRGTAVNSVLLRMWHYST